MPKVPRQTKVQGIERVASTRRTRQMPLSVISSVDLNLTVKHTNDSTGADNTLLGLLQLITKLELILDGQDNIISIPFYFLYFMNYYDNSKAPHSSLFVTNSTAGTSKVSVNMPHKFMRGIVPDDGLLDARPLSSSVMHTDWSSGAGYAGSASIDSGTILEIDINEYTNVVDPGQLRKSLARHEYAYESKSLTKTGEVQIDIPTKGTNQYYRMWLFAFNSSSVLSDSVISNIKLQTRSFVYIDKTAERIQFKNQLDYSISYQTGVYILDFTTLGRMSERLDARLLPELTLKVTSAVTDGVLDLVYEKAVFS